MTLEMMLDEAIAHAEGEAKHYEEILEKDKEKPYLFSWERRKCSESIDEHRQLAVWLRELKRYKDQETREDAISRKEAQMAISKIVWKDGETWDDVHDRCVDCLDDLPSVQPQPKTGHWIRKQGSGIGYDLGGIKTWYAQYMCSECGFIKTAIEDRADLLDHCAGCGAKMESEGKE